MDLRSNGFGLVGRVGLSFQLGSQLKPEFFGLGEEQVSVDPLLSIAGGARTELSE